MIIALIMLLGDQTLHATNDKLVSWSVGGFCLSLALSLAPFVTSRGLLELEQGPSCGKACCRLVRHTKRQASRGVDARVTEVKARAAAAAET